MEHVGHFKINDVSNIGMITCASDYRTIDLCIKMFTYSISQIKNKWIEEI